MFQVRGRVSGEWEWRLFLIRLGFCAQLLARARDSEPFLVEKFLDPQDVFNVFPPVHPLAGVALHRFELRKFGFPETQNIGRQAAETSDFTDAEVKLLRD